MNLGTKERCGCVSVKENLLPSEGFASYPITEEQRENGKAEKAVAQTALEAVKPHPSLSCRVSQCTLSACWPLAIQMSVSPLSLPLKFPVARTRGNGPFHTI